jgi:hypothetical protein
VNVRDVQGRLTGRVRASLRASGVAGNFHFLVDVVVQLGSIAGELENAAVIGAKAEAATLALQAAANAVLRIRRADRAALRQRAGIALRAALAAL